MDEDPSNHDLGNLAVLCFDCHRDTQITGGFDRKLDAYQVRFYRDDWTRRVQNRRTVSHGPETVSAGSGSALPPPVASWPSQPVVVKPSPSSGSLELDLIISLPGRRLNVYRRAQPKWDTGVTAELVEGNGYVITELRSILIDLARFYPDGHFDGRRPDDYFSAEIVRLAEWHRRCLEPAGPRTGGTIVSVMTGGEVIASLEKMISDMVGSLTSFRDDFNFHAWRREWTDGAKGV